MAYSNTLAGVTTEDSFTPFNLFAGDTPAVATTQALVLSGQNLAIFTVVARNTAGKIVVWDPTDAGSAVVTGSVGNDTITGGSAAVDGPESFAIGIAAQALDASAGDITGPIYVAGHFNHAALVWPGAVTTVADRRAAFYGSPIVISALL